jgi:hypothetical protein
MKHVILIILISINSLFAQTSREELLRQVQSRNDLKIAKEEKPGSENIYKVEYPNGKTNYQNLTIKKEDTSTVSTTTINVWEIDTTLYQNMYTYWQEVLACNASNERLVIGDLNNNGKKEIYGYTKDYDELLGREPIKIYELDSAYKFNYKYSYPDTVKIVKGIYDSNNDGVNQLYLSSKFGNGIVYKSPNNNSFPTNVDFVFFRYPSWGQMNDPTFGDFDKNGKTDLVFYEFRKQKSYVFEYNNVINNFDSIASLPPDSVYCAGYAVGDFDLDGKIEIVYGNVYGKVFLVEADSHHIYSHTWSDTVDTYNAYMQMATNDLDKNGKPEFWVGGAAFYDPNPPITRFTCFEATGDNKYKEVYRIDIVGIFSFYAGNCFPLDVDKDGTEELVICLDQHVFIFKFTGKPGKLSYKLFYVKRNNLNGAYFGVTMNDLDYDGNEELLIHQSVVRQDEKAKHFTAIFKPNFLNDAENDQAFYFDNYLLEACYPNPFNSSTNINFQVPLTSQVIIKVFDLLGKEVTRVFEGEVSIGKHRITWDGKDQNNNLVNSGIYFVQFISGNIQKTIKTLLLK